MDIISSIEKTFIQILQDELVPALGCTEPIAIAYAAAKARDVLGDTPTSIIIENSSNIIKNVKSVVVPNTGGMKGIKSAVAAGIIGGDASKRLEVIKNLSSDQQKQLQPFIDNTPIELKAIDDGHIFDIRITLMSKQSKAVVRITEYHTNISYVEKNGEVILDDTNKTAISDEQKIASLNLPNKSLLSIENIVNFANTCSIDLIKPILELQIAYNTEISNMGLKEDFGANIGSLYAKVYSDSPKNRAISKAAAGSDARMNGCELPVIINSGSGNQGMTVSLPVIEYAKTLNVSDEKLYRALSISNLVAVHIKRGIGRLSAYCGAVSAGAAAGCGIAYLNGEDSDGISKTLINALAINSGIICDGAKSSCAAKIATSVDAGITGYHMHVNGQYFKDGEGIVGKDVEETIKNVGVLASEGMKYTDKKIVDIMICD